MQREKDSVTDLQVAKYMLVLMIQGLLTFHFPRPQRELQVIFCFHLCEKA